MSTFINDRTDIKHIKPKPGSFIYAIPTYITLHGYLSSVFSVKAS